MQASDACIEIIKRYEGFRSKPYLCPSCVPTIGYGHTGGVSLADPAISEERATELLRDDLLVSERGVLAAVAVPLTQNQFDALVSLTFNIGAGNFNTSTLRRRLNAGDYAGAASEFDKWNKGRQGGELVILPGLVRRRAEERRMFEGRI